jgi:hypothetical protein
MLFLKVCQVPRGDLEAVCHLLAGEEAVSHGFILPPSLRVMSATSARDWAVKTPSPILTKRGWLQSAGHPPKGTRTNSCR